MQKRRRSVDRSLFIMLKDCFFQLTWGLIFVRNSILGKLKELWILSERSYPPYVEGSVKPFWKELYVQHTHYLEVDLWILSERSYPPYVEGSVKPFWKELYVQHTHYLEVEQWILSERSYTTPFLEGAVNHPESSYPPYLGGAVNPFWKELSFLPRRSYPSYLEGALNPLWKELYFLPRRSCESSVEGAIYPN